MLRPRVLIVLSIMFTLGSCSSRGGSTSPPEAPPSTDLPKATGPAIPPPEPGTYLSDRVLRANGNESTTTRPSEVEKPAPNGGGVQQRVWSYDGMDRLAFNESLWRADGAYTTARYFSAEGFCRYGPPLLWVRSSLKVGLSWKSKAACANDSTPRRTVEASYEVSSTKSLTLDGTELELFVIEADFVFSGFYSDRLMITETTAYSPAFRLEVESKGTGRVGQGPDPFYEYEVRLKSPRPTTGGMAIP